MSGVYRTGVGLLQIPVLILILVAEHVFETLTFVVDPITGCVNVDWYASKGSCLYMPYRRGREDSYALVTFQWGGKNHIVSLHALAYVWREKEHPDAGTQLVHLCQTHCTTHVTPGRTGTERSNDFMRMGPTSYN